jgi:excisionase family DNA binding protein
MDSVELDKEKPLMAEKIETVTVKGAAELVGSSRRNITHLIESGTLPALRLGRGKHDHYRIRVADLDGLFKPQGQVTA